MIFEQFSFCFCINFYGLNLTTWTIDRYATGDDVAIIHHSNIQVHTMPSLALLSRPHHHHLALHHDDTSSCGSSQIDVSAAVTSSSLQIKTSQPLTAQVSSSAAISTKSILKKSKNSDSQSSKSVQFHKSVRCKPTLAAVDYTQRELEATWYNESEMTAIKLMNKIIVQQMTKQESKKCIKSKTSSETYCTRGLESRTKNGHKQRKRQRTESRCAVLDEQCRQKEMDDFDPNYIAFIYTEKCLESTRSARLLGIKDESIARALQ